MDSDQYCHTRSSQKKGHGGHFVCPISRRTGHLSAILFVEDNNLIYVDMGKNQSADEATYDLQHSIDIWGQLLMASGGSLKPEKCLLYLMLFAWKTDRKRSYESNETNNDFTMGVQMPEGTMCQIEHLSVDTAKGTLGVFTCPSGNFGTHLLSTKKKG